MLELVGAGSITHVRLIAPSPWRVERKFFSVMFDAHVLIAGVRNPLMFMPTPLSASAQVPMLPSIVNPVSPDAKRIVSVGDVGLRAPVADCAMSVIALFVPVHVP